MLYTTTAKFAVTAEVGRAPLHDAAILWVTAADPSRSASSVRPLRPCSPLLQGGEELQGDDPQAASGSAGAQTWRAIRLVPHGMHPACYAPYFAALDVRLYGALRAGASRRNPQGDHGAGSAQIMRKLGQGGMGTAYAVRRRASHDASFLVLKTVTSLRTLCRHPAACSGPLRRRRRRRRIVASPRSPTRSRGRVH